MPDPVLGWPLATLLDQPAERLLISGIGVAAPVCRGRCWPQRPEGSPVMPALSAAPLSDPEDGIVGARGMRVDWSEYDGGA